MDEQCVLVDAWLHKAGTLGPPDHLIGHVLGCPRCRGVLAVMAADLIRLHPALADVDETAIEDQLPAFIDYERAYGPAAAARTFPLVWWYLLISPQCAQSYAELLELSALQLPAFAPVRRRQLRYPEIELHLTVVQRQLRAAQRLGARWGARSPDTVIAEREAAALRVQLSFRREGDQQLALMVHVEPPVSGVAVLQIADRQLRATLDSYGDATFEHLDEGLFLTDGEAALRVTIEPLGEGER